MRLSDFSTYNGGDQFIYQEKIFNRSRPLGVGSFGEASLFTSDPNKQCVVVKSERAHGDGYHFGGVFKNEAVWYQKIYGVGEFVGDVKNSTLQHHILIPFFAGSTLSEKVFRSEKELFFHWIWTAIAIQNLHNNHQVIHGDLKSDNVIAGKDSVFLIDFGFTTRISQKRNVTFEAADKFFISHQPPELFFDVEEKNIAAASQDVYCLGHLLRELFSKYFLNNFSVLGDLLDVRDKVRCVSKNMTSYAPKERWSIEKSIYLLTVACLSTIPKNIWWRMMLGVLPHDASTIFSVLIQGRIDELKAEQEKLRTPSSVKDKKIKGLSKLKQNIFLQSSGVIETVQLAKKDQSLVAGFFSQRTKRLLCDLGEMGSVFQLLK